MDDRLTDTMLDRVRTLRREATPAERAMWRLLRDRRLGGAKFRRQHPAEGSILDFYCHEARLAVELDGGGHGEQAQRERDELRDRILAAAGIRVLRFTNQAALERPVQVLDALEQALVGLRDQS